MGNIYNNLGKKCGDYMQKQYELAIDAKNKLNENFHKWMSFYYVANSAILLSVVGIANQQANMCCEVSFALAVIGVVISIFWKLSCKGHLYWSQNWIEVIFRLEEQLFKDNDQFKIYSIFSKKVHSEKRDFNVSTPKLTLYFSYIVHFSWVIYSIFPLWIILRRYFNSYCLVLRCIIIFIYIVIAFWGHSLFRNNLKSRTDGSHTLFE
ncbi:MAG: hypothetical protein CSA38_05660 [Flavobacteriales bacterium]|nr:MAG: hypothetical protein CSA38_05660 [Flavobacteriales bacterium]